MHIVDVPTARETVVEVAARATPVGVVEAAAVAGVLPAAGGMVSDIGVVRRGRG